MTFFDLHLDKVGSDSGGPLSSSSLPCLIPKNSSNHHTGQPVLAAVRREEREVVIEANFTVCMSLLMASSTFGLGRRQWSFFMALSPASLHTMPCLIPKAT